MNAPTTVAVIGAGWSGLACALALQKAGCVVTVVDAAPHVGGRARRLDVTLGDRTYALDNGQHLLIGAYRETLHLIREVGLDPKRLLLRTPFVLRYPDGFVLAAARAPAPWHLAGALFTARGLTLADRASLAHDVHSWRRRAWSVPSDISAADLMRTSATRIVERVWRPLCLAALNVDLDRASARVLLTVLRDSLGSDATACDLLLARTDLSALFPSAAARTLTGRGAILRLRESAIALQSDVGGWRVQLRDDALHVDAVVLAVPPARAAALLASASLGDLSAASDQLLAIAAAPIATIYLRYPETTCLPAPMLALRDDPAHGRFGHWVFDRGALDRACAGVISVVVSGDGAHLALTRAELAAAAARQLAQEFGWSPPLAAMAVVEKHATIVPAPGLRRPPARLPARGLFLAADAADSPYPSTIEGSVRAGLAAARALLEDITAARLASPSPDGSR